MSKNPHFTQVPGVSNVIAPVTSWDLSDLAKVELMKKEKKAKGLNSNGLTIQDQL